MEHVILFSPFTTSQYGLNHLFTHVVSILDFCTYFFFTLYVFVFPFTHNYFSKCETLCFIFYKNASISTEPDVDDLVSLLSV